MKQFFTLTILILAIGCSSSKTQKVKPVKTNTNISKIAFGSCSKADKNQPILETVLEKNPELFIYLGDNIYGDTEDMELLQAKYDKLGSKQEFQNLRSNCMVLATWDDHDYGDNDAGRPLSHESGI